MITTTADTKTQEIKLNVPADILLTLNQSEKELEQNIKLSLATYLFQQKKITLGKAAQLAGLSRYDFEISLAEQKIPISQLTATDVMADIQKFG